MQKQDNQNIKQLQVENKEDTQKYSILVAELLEFGFDEKLIQQSLKHTDNKQKAAQIILRFTQLGITADISDIIPPKITLEKPLVPVKQGFKYKMIFLVNMSLKMGKGKICAQVAHACLFAYLQMHDEARFHKDKQTLLNGWQSFGCAKIVVKVDSTKELQKFKQLLDKKNINNFLVEDAGKTQIKSGSRTVLGVGPVESQIIDPITQNLKLL